MIVDWCLDLLSALIYWVAGLLPADDTGWWEGFSGFATHMSDLNYFIPIQELVTFTLGVSAVLMLFAPVKIVLWLLSWVRGGAQA